MNFQSKFCCLIFGLQQKLSEHFIYKMSPKGSCTKILGLQLNATALAYCGTFGVKEDEPLVRTGGLSLLLLHCLK